MMSSSTRSRLLLFLLALPVLLLFLVLAMRGNDESQMGKRETTIRKDSSYRGTRTFTFLNSYPFTFPATAGTLPPYTF